MSSSLLGRRIALDVSPRESVITGRFFFPLKEVFPAVNLLSPMSGQPDVRVAELSDLQAQLFIFFAAFPAKLEGSKSQNNVPKTTQLWP